MHNHKLKEKKKRQKGKLKAITTANSTRGWLSVTVKEGFPEEATFELRPKGT
jgi:hypothetical protein